MLETVCKNTQRQRLGFCQCVIECASIDKDTGKLSYLGKPAPIIFLLILNVELHISICDRPKALTSVLSPSSRVASLIIILHEPTVCGKRVALCGALAARIHVLLTQPGRHAHRRLLCCMADGQRNSEV